MKSLFLFSPVLFSFYSFGQLGYMRDFKKAENGFYELCFKDVRDAIHKYNYVLDMNGSDTNDIVYNVMKNPIDFGFFKNNPNSENIIVSIFLRDGNKYKIIFTEIDGSSDKYFFDVVDQNGIETALYYRKKKMEKQF
jgi:hypothetical protein